MLAGECATTLGGMGRVSGKACKLHEAEMKSFDALDTRKKTLAVQEIYGGNRGRNIKGIRYGRGFVSCS